MKRIAITQRLTHIDAYNETRDCLDIRWAPLLIALNYTPVILPTLPPEYASAYISTLNIDGLILSGGNSIGESDLRDTYETALITHCLQNNIPILGVCRGMQMLNSYFGGTLTPIKAHAATHHPITGRTNNVNSYHDFGIMPAHLAAPLQATATAPDGSIEACTHISAPIKAIMWHPEREAALHPEDKHLIQEFFK